MKIKKLSHKVLEEVADILSEGGIVCFPTDTIYGLLALARRKDAVERLYSLRRPSGRPFLLLLPDAGWVRELGLRTGWVFTKLMEWFNATFIFYKKNTIPLYLTRGRKSLAVRIPPFDSHMHELLSLLQEPVVAPSANPEGERPAVKIKEAVEYFGDLVDLYVDGGRKEGKPSTIVRALYPKGLRLIREGSIPFKDILHAYRGLANTFSSFPEDALSEFFSLDPSDPGPPFLPPR
ncbi:MAG: L-threonylcarbamoyladenylate synthase [Aquificaceae bacterium]